jgi:hypothetical protein
MAYRRPYLGFEHGIHADGLCCSVRERRYLNTDIRMLEDGVLDTTRTKHINTVWPIGSVYYQPSKMFTFERTSNPPPTEPYTRVTPHTDIGGRFIARVRPTDKF